MSLRKVRILSSIFLPVVTTGLYSQVANGIVAGGYRTPAPTGMNATPGQVLTLFVQGVSVPDATASTLPLPVVLSGLSVKVRPNTGATPPNYPSALPIFRVHSADPCDGTLALGSCVYTQVTVQFPTEPDCMSSGGDVCGFPLGHRISLYVSVNGSAGPDFPVSTFLGAPPHFIDGCDTIFNGNGGCGPRITHGDGSPIIGGVHSGETIVMYAVGLGFVDPSVPTGAAAKSPAFSGSPSDYPLIVSFGSTSSDKIPYVPVDHYFYPSFVGIVPGYVGLYQVNFTVPNPSVPTFGMRIQFASASDYVYVPIEML